MVGDRFSSQGCKEGMDDAVVPRSAGEWREELDNLSWIKEERHAAQLGCRLACRLSSYEVEEIIEALRWLFRGWRLGSIAKCLSNLIHGMDYRKTIIVLVGVMEGWSARHVAELLVLLYFHGGSTERRREAWEIIRLLKPRRLAIDVMSLIESCCIIVRD